MPAAAGFHIAVSSDGDVSPRAVERAEEKLEKIADLAPGPVLHGQLRLVMEPNPARPRPAKVEGALDVDGRIVRAQVAAPTMQEAVDRFADRLRSRLMRSVGRLRARRGSTGEAEPGQWRQADLATDRPDYFDRPPGERQIVRRKTFASPSSSPEEAVLDMEALDHDFFLFRNSKSGEENVVHRTADGDYELIQPSGSGTDSGPGHLRPSKLVPPTISLQDAVTMLDVGNQPFLFFFDVDGGKGAVLYRRYDGHYGLITLESAD